MCSKCNASCLTCNGTNDTDCLSCDESTKQPVLDSGKCIAKVLNCTTHNTVTGRCDTCDEGNTAINSGAACVTTI